LWSSYDRRWFFGPDKQEIFILIKMFETVSGWLEPMADRLVTDPNVAVYPNIEIISAETLEVHLNHNVDFLGVFRWRDLTFQWATMTPEQRSSQSRPSTADPIK
jgi:hypothetical protein